MVTLAVGIRLPALSAALTSNCGLGVELDPDALGTKVFSAALLADFCQRLIQFTSDFER